jgi:glycosyltransferase involved in cell wall biosynthesis
MLNKEIFYITPVLIPGSSAASKRIIANAKLIQLLNYNVTIFSGLDVGDQFIVDGVPIVTTGLKIKGEKGIKKLISYKKSVRYFTEILTKRDPKTIKAIFVYSGYSFYLAPLLKWSRKKKIPLVFDAVEWYTPKKRIHWFLKPYFWNTEFSMRYLIPQTKNVVVISTFLEKYYKNKDCNTVVIPPLYFTKVKPKTLKNRNYLQLSYTGSPGKKDNLNMLIEAILELNKLRKTKKIKFEIAGLNNDELLSYSAFKSKNIKKVPDYFKAHGYIKMKQAQEITASSDFSILFRKNDKTNTAGFPTKAVESLSLGTPLFMNYSSDLHLFFKDEVNAIIIETLSVKEIKKQLIKLVNMPVSRIYEMKQNAIITAIDNFHIESRIEDMKCFLNNLRI